MGHAGFPVRALTIVFVLLVAVPAATLGWLGFRYADSLERETRERIRRETLRGWARAQSNVLFEAYGWQLELKRECAAYARAVEREMPFGVPRAPVKQVGPLLVRMAIEDRDGKPLGRTEFPELPEWPLFERARRMALGAEWVADDRPAALRILKKARAEIVSPRLSDLLERHAEQIQARGAPPAQEEELPFTRAATSPLPFGSRVALDVRFVGGVEPVVSTLKNGVRSRVVYVRGGTPTPSENALGTAHWGVDLDLPGGVRALVELTHPEAANFAADIRRRKGLTLGGIAALLALMVVGLALARRALSREQAARQLRDAFIANVSHELKTPLTSVRMYAEMLADDQIGPDKRAEYGRVVNAEGARLAALVDDMLDFSALERGARELEVEPVDIARLAHATAEAWKPLVERAGVELEIVGPTRDIVALADATALARILANLLQNALRHGRPARDGKAPRIRVEVNGALTVCDNGPGVGTAEREAIFDRFRRGAEAGNKPGAGIGLALSRELARAMDGDLMVEDDGTWTRFTLRLPPVPDEPA